jgi:hypothetical protein
MALQTVQNHPGATTAVATMCAGMPRSDRASDDLVSGQVARAFKRAALSSPAPSVSPGWVTRTPRRRESTWWVSIHADCVLVWKLFWQMRGRGGTLHGAVTRRLRHLL